MRPIISVENLSKSYHLGQIGTGTFRDDLKLWWAKTRGKPNPLARIGDKDHGNRDGEEIWALRDVSFTVEQGQAVGIIGRNGAGKSTLLKILSRITAPTSGKVKVKGRIASLLEVGTGFHPELTGRENIYLNGSILGMNRREIVRKFDEIVDFSGVEKFIDTPVKRYSSGMYVRLAFAVAAHLEPEILIVDEVLAVGDAEFQKKCLGKMGDVAHEGRTVLFVSHNMAAVQSLCSRAIWLGAGMVLYTGGVKETVEQYLQSTVEQRSIPLVDRKDRGGNQTVLLTSIVVENANGQGNDATIHCVDQLCIRLGYRAEKTLRWPRFLISINDYSDTGIYFLDSNAMEGMPNELPAIGIATCITGPINITPGRCYINVAVLNGNDLADHVQHAYHLNIDAEDFYGAGKLPLRQNSVCLIAQTWLMEKRANEN